jgi:hypothetical protein
MADRVYHRIICNKCGSELGIVRKNVGGLWLKTQRETTDTKAYSGQCPVCYAPVVVPPPPVPPPIPPPIPPPTTTMGALNLSGVHDKVFEGVTFDGAGTGGPDSSGVIAIWGGCYNLTFRNCVINPNRDGVGNGIKIVGGDVRDILFEGCITMPQPRMGFECIGRGGSGYQRVNLLNCIFEPQGSEAVSYDDDTGGAGNCVIDGILVKGGGAGSLYSWGQGFEFNNVANMELKNSTFWACRGDVWNFQMASRACNWNVHDNIIDTTKGTIAQIGNAVCAQNVWGGLFPRNTIVYQGQEGIGYMAGCRGMDWRTTTWGGKTPQQVGCSGMLF